MRVRVVVAIALLLVAGALALDMSGRAPRTAGTNHVSAAAFTVAVPGGQEMCQAATVLPPNVQSVRVLVGSFGQRLPALRARFLDARGVQVAAGSLPAGGREGTVAIPLHGHSASSVAGTLCIANAGRARLVLGGEPFAPAISATTVAGTPAPGRIAVLYERPGRESWWQLLPALDERFGLGKWSLFGDWTLPVMALLLLGVWVATVRLLLRELRT